MKFTNTNILCRALTNKIHEIEFQQKNNTQYPYGNNEDLTGIGQQFIEFFFTEYLLRRGYPNKLTQLKKYSDIVTLKQKLLCEKNLAEIALDLNIHNLVQVGNQVALKKNPKILAETFKAILGAQYFDSGYDLDHMRDIIQPALKELLDKGQSIKVPELKQNAKSAFLEFVSNYVDLKPKISCEWKKESVLQGNVENTYSISLELDNIFKITKEGTNKKNTEQLVYKEGLLKLKQTYQNQTKSKTPQEQQQSIQDLKQSVCEETLTFEINDERTEQDISQFLELGDSTFLGSESAHKQQSITQKIDYFFSQFDV